MWLITLTTIVIAFYIILIRIFKTGWKSTEEFHGKRIFAEAPFKVSVVVTCRNEEKALPRLLSCLSRQTYQDFELILVDDHSTDHTLQIMKEATHANVICIQAQKQGKKSAQAEGILTASGDLIITTDADCEPVAEWVSTIAQFQCSNPSHLIICPVELKPDKSFFSRLQQFEFVSLVAAGAGAAGAHYPIMCNAANMAFTKDAWLASRKDLKQEEQSGDDIFLLQSIKKKGGIISVLKSEKAFVRTKAAKNLREFIRQRRRWAGKSTAYTDFALIATACIIFATCFLQLSLLIAGCFNVLYFYFFVFFFVLKYWTDSRFLQEASSMFRLPQIWIYSFFLSLVYPFYIVFTAISALLFKPQKW